MMGWDWGFGWGGMLFGGLMMVVFWGGLIALIVFAIRGFTSNSNASGNNRNSSISTNSTTQTPLEILQARYARGEISQHEYETVRQDLQAI
jgi:putative membrane protein